MKRERASSGRHAAGQTQRGSAASSMSQMIKREGEVQSSRVGGPACC